MRHFFLALKLFFISFVFLASEAHATTTKNQWYWGLGYMSLKSEFIKPEDVKEWHDDNFITAHRRGGGRSAFYSQRRIDFDDATTGYRLFLGVSANPNWDFELSYFDFGDLQATFTAGQIQARFSHSEQFAEANVKAIGFHAQYRNPIFDVEDLEVLFRWGLTSWDGSIQTSFVTDNENISPMTGEINESGWDWFYGLGLSYQINDRWRTRLDLDRFIFGGAEADALNLTFEYNVDWALF